MFYHISSVFFFTCDSGIYSRINIGCKTLLDGIYCALIGLLMGIVYYNLIKDYYKADYLEEELLTANNDINNFFSIN